MWHSVDSRDFDAATEQFLRAAGIWSPPYSPLLPSTDRPWHRYDEWPDDHNCFVLAMLENGKYIKAHFNIDTAIWSARGVVAWQYLD